MRNKLATTVLFVFLAGCAAKPSAVSVVLSTAQTQLLLKQCSRPSPSNVGGFWVPSAKVTHDINERIAAVSKLRSPRGKVIAEPQKYLRQYAGVLVGGKKFVYINAFSLPPVMPPSTLHWHVKAVVVCDGGNTAWGAMYDPATQQFSQLTVNGQIGGA